MIYITFFFNFAQKYPIKVYKIIQCTIKEEKSVKE